MAGDAPPLPDANAALLQAVRAMQQGQGGGSLPFLGPDAKGILQDTQGFAGATVKFTSQGRQTLADKMFAAIQAIPAELRDKSANASVMYSGSYPEGTLPGLGGGGFGGSNSFADNINIMTSRSGSDTQVG